MLVRLLQALALVSPPLLAEASSPPIPSCSVRVEGAIRSEGGEHPVLAARLFVFEGDEAVPINPSSVRARVRFLENGDFAITLSQINRSVGCCADLDHPLTLFVTAPGHVAQRTTISAELAWAKDFPNERCVAALEPIILVSPARTYVPGT
jgi:hypothetical protein